MLQRRKILRVGYCVVATVKRRRHFGPPWGEWRRAVVDLLPAAVADVGLPGEDHRGILDGGERLEGGPDTGTLAVSTVVCETDLPLRVKLDAKLLELVPTQPQPRCHASD